MWEQCLEQVGNLRHYPKGTYLFRQGEHSDDLLLIYQGLAKVFYKTLEGKEFIKSFLIGGEFITSLNTLESDKPSTFSVLSLEHTVARAIPQHTFKKLLDDNPGISRQFTTVLINLAMKKEQREYELLCLSPEERYCLFCEQNPTMEQRIAQNDIARYLGITPVALCRIRKRFQTDKPHA